MASLLVLAMHCMATEAVAQGGGGAEARPQMPVATRGVHESYFGQDVSDPYRWMENLAAPATMEWIANQESRANLFLAGLADRKALLARLKVLNDARTAIYDVQQWGDWVFYLKLRAGDEVPTLMVRRGPSGEERVLVNPARDSPAASVASFDYLAPSMDGRYIAYGSSQGGSENSEIRIVQTATGRALPDRIDRANFGGIAWAPDGKAFYYVRLPALPPGAPAQERYQNIRTYRHVLDTDPATDVVIAGPGVSPAMPVARDEIAYLRTIPGSDRIFALIIRGT
jgi:prolyl oligopeptidase